MSDTIETGPSGEARLEREAARALRRLAEQGACLALAPGMETAVVVRESADGATLRTAVVDREVAEAMALRDWIKGGGQGRILRYRITAAGRAALKRLVAEAENRKARGAVQGFAEDQSAFAGAEPRKGARYSLAESPLVGLARRRDRVGRPFLTDGMLAAGERLREDYELAQVGQGGARDWEAAIAQGSVAPGDAAGRATTAAEAAARRVEAALAALGPGLGDVALRCCCFLEGLECVEARMGWSARSGKIVLRIALQRLERHYDSGSDDWSPLIG